MNTLTSGRQVTRQILAASLYMCASFRTLLPCGSHTSVIKGVIKLYHTLFGIYCTDVCTEVLFETDLNWLRSSHTPSFCLESKTWKYFVANDSDERACARCYRALSSTKGGSLFNHIKGATSSSLQRQRRGCNVVNSATEQTNTCKVELSTSVISSCAKQIRRLTFAWPEALEDLESQRSSWSAKTFSPSYRIYVIDGNIFRII